MTTLPPCLRSSSSPVSTCRLPFTLRLSSPSLSSTVRPPFSSTSRSLPSLSVTARLPFSRLSASSPSFNVALRLPFSMVKASSPSLSSTERFPFSNVRASLPSLSVVIRLLFSNVSASPPSPMIVTVRASSTSQENIFWACRYTSSASFVSSKRSSLPACPSGKLRVSRPEQAACSGSAHGGGLPEL